MRVRRAFSERRARRERGSKADWSTEPSGVIRGYSRDGEQSQTPLSSPPPGVICLVTPSSLLPKGVEEARLAMPGERGWEGSS